MSYSEGTNTNEYYLTEEKYNTLTQRKDEYDNIRDGFKASSFSNHVLLKDEIDGVTLDDIDYFLEHKKQDQRAKTQTEISKVLTRTE